MLDDLNADLKKVAGAVSAEDRKLLPQESVFQRHYSLVGLHARLRDDAVTEGDRREANQRSAPAVEDGLFLVPKVIE